MSLRKSYAIGREEGFPRVSGDEPGRGSTGKWLVVFSPRERG